MITNEMLQVVAEYDGMSVFQTEHDLFFKRGIECTPESYDYHLLHLKYATSMDWLHPVAIKAYSELIDCKYNDISDITDRCQTIQVAILRKPVNGQYIDLFNAVYEAILFINQNK